MAIVLMYNDHTGRMERYESGLQDSMPYNTGHTLTVGEFKGSSCSNVLWSNRAAMESWNVTRSAFGRPIPLGYAFKRIWEGGHGAQSQHYAGVSFDAGQSLTGAWRNELRDTAIRLGVWGYVEPAYLTPTWVHFDKRAPNPACATGGYPRVLMGSKNTYVLVLQDALNALGHTTHGLDGIFGNNTRGAVLRFQADNGLIVDGIAGCQTWRRLVDRALGIGQTDTVVYTC
ncbi:MAG: peptidoglycan-binding protein [Clostridiales bacterium]|jgi:hypothetical protein|nr:peptidoglycan-binding protein [Clostridiales bacterium]